MIERASEFGASAAVPLVTSDSSMQTAGEMLRAAREAHGIDVAVVAAALKVPVQKVEALEDDDFEALPDPVFARALAASICRALRIDAKPVLEKLPGARQPGLAESQRRANATFRPAPARNGGSGVGSRILVVVVALLLIGAALLVWLPPAKLEQMSAAVDRVLSGGRDATPGEETAAPGSVVTSPAPTSVQTSPAVVSAPVLTPAAPSPSGAGGSATPMATSPGAAAQPGAATATSPAVPGASPALPGSTAPAVGVATAPATPGATAPAAGSPATPVDPNAIVSFTARSEAWISVTDSGGKQLLRRLVKAGETVAVPGEPPLAVVVGNAVGVDVTVRGKPFDLKDLTRSGGVARFEIKP